MNINTNIRFLIGIITSFSAVFLPIVVQSSPLLSEPKTEYLLSVEFPSLGDEKPAGETVSGGKRGNCAEEVPLTAIAPQNSVVTTLSSNPSLYWFIPETNGVKAEFILVDAEGNDVYIKEIESVTKSGLVKLTIPESIELQPEQTYEWKFLLICTAGTGESELSLGTDSVGGQIQLLELTDAQQENVNAIATETESATQLLQKASLYAEYGLWQETLTSLEQLRQLEPDLGMKEWSELLNSVGIEAEEVVTASFVGEL